jgi:hypothetical protein
MGVRQTREMVSDEMTSDRGEWRDGGRWHAVTTANELGKGQKEEE